MANEYEDQFVQYSRITIVEARPYVAGEDMTNILVIPGTEPKEGDMIARNPRDRDEQWLMPHGEFTTNFESVAESRGAPKTAAKPARKEF